MIWNILCVSLKKRKLTHTAIRKYALTQLSAHSSSSSSICYAMLRCCILYKLLPILLNKTKERRWKKKNNKTYTLFKIVCCCCGWICQRCLLLHHYRGEKLRPTVSLQLTWHVLAKRGWSLSNSPKTLTEAEWQSSWLKKITIFHSLYRQIYSFILPLSLSTRRRQLRYDFAQLKNESSFHGAWWDSNWICSVITPRVIPFSICGCNKFVAHKWQLLRRSMDVWVCVCVWMTVYKLQFLSLSFQQTINTESQLQIAYYVVNMLHNWLGVEVFGE